LEYESPEAATLSNDEILGNCFIFLFAGHETTANNIHYSIVELAMSLPIQRDLQSDVEKILGDKRIDEFSYYTDMPRLYNSMVGAVMHEGLRLIPATLSIPKRSNGDQIVTIDGKESVIPGNVFIHLNVVGTNRNPRYWPRSPDEFIPERWLPFRENKVLQKQAVDKNEDSVADGLEVASFETSGLASLLKPMKGSYIPFSEGARACPGRRFAQVEVTAVLSVIFQTYSVELDVSDWASDEEIGKMPREKRKEVYEKAIQRASDIVRRSKQIITLQMRRGDYVPVRFVKKGRERFADCF
jgi:cytochrome P450